MRKMLGLLMVSGAAALLAACGHTTEQKTATGAIAGAGNVVGHATDGKPR